MSGVKGRSGGARPNTGGARPGAGRKPAPKPEVVPVEPRGEDDPLKLLLDIAYGRVAVAPDQLKAAIAAVQYTHTRARDGGKKEAAQEKAKTAAGKFGARPAPLKLVG